MVALVTAQLQAVPDPPNEQVHRGHKGSEIPGELDP